METNQPPFDEKIFNEIRNSLAALNGATDSNVRDSILIDQLLRMNTALEQIYKAVSIASPSVMNSTMQVSADKIPGDEISRLLTSHSGHLAAHDQHLAAHDRHLVTLSERIDMLKKT